MFYTERDDRLKIGVVDVGGGLRGGYAAGVFDRLTEENIYFDVCIGVSAGSANCASFLAGQKGRNYPFYTDYPFRREYMGIGNIIHKGCYLDLHYIYSELSNSDGENPLDCAALLDSPSAYYAVATNAVTGEARYFTKENISQDHYDVFKASCAIPVACQPIVIDGQPYYDGALSDPVPLQKAFDLGCDTVVLILTKPRDEWRNPQKDIRSARLIQKKYPKAADGLRHRAARYNVAVTWAKKLEQEGKVLIVAPDDTCGIDTLTKDKNALKLFYQKGYADGQGLAERLQKYRRL